MSVPDVGLAEESTPDTDTDTDVPAGSLAAMPDADLPAGSGPPRAQVRKTY